MSNPIDIRKRLKDIIKDSAVSVTEYTSIELRRNTPYTVGDIVRPTPYLCYTYKCTKTGITGATTPFMSKSGGISPDGTVMWQEDSDEYDLAIKAALSIFSLHEPTRLRSAIDGNNSSVYNLPDEWENEFSQILQIEYPLEQIPSIFLHPDEFELYQSTSESWKILIYGNIPSSESFGLYFTALRSPISIPNSHIEAFTWLCASLWLSKLANSYITSTDSSINIDTVDYKDKASQFRSQAKYFLKMYREFMGINEEGVSSSSYISNISTINYPLGYERLTHPRLDRYTR